MHRAAAAAFVALPGARVINQHVLHCLRRHAEAMRATKGVSWWRVRQSSALQRRNN